MSMRLGLHDPLYDSRKEGREIEKDGRRVGRRERKEKERVKHCQIVDIDCMQSFPISIVLCPFVFLTLGLF